MSTYSLPWVIVVKKSINISPGSQPRWPLQKWPLALQPSGHVVNRREAVGNDVAKIRSWALDPCLENAAKVGAYVWSPATAADALVALGVGRLDHGFRQTGLVFHDLWLAGLGALAATTQRCADFQTEVRFVFSSARIEAVCQRS
jgi:hypothetical protein